MNNSLEDIISKIKAGKDLDDISYKPSKIKNSVSVQPKLEKIEVEKPKELTSGSGNTFNSLMQTSDKLEAQDRQSSQMISEEDCRKRMEYHSDFIPFLVYGSIVALLLYFFS